MNPITNIIQDPIYTAYDKKDASNCKKALLFTASILLTPVGVMASVADTLITIIESMSTNKKDYEYQELINRKFRFISFSFAFPMILIYGRNRHPFDITDKDAGMGLLSGIINRRSLQALAEKNSTASNPIQRHLISRCLYLLSGVVGIVARIVDLAIGLIAPLPLLLFNPQISFQLFARGLAITGIFSDIGYAIAKTINPFTLEKPKA